MEKLILHSFPFSVSENGFFSAVSIDPEDDPELAGEALEVFKAGLAVARPKAVCACLPTDVSGSRVSIGHVTIENEFIAQKLASGGICVPYVGTCGAEVRAWAETLSDPMHSWWADGLMLLLLREAMKALSEQVRSRFFPGAPHVTSLNPGSLSHWPIEGQTDLFAMLSGGAEEIGVELTPSMLMLPAKSGSGIFFSSSREYENCELCPRTDCPNRRMPYSGTTEWRTE